MGKDTATEPRIHHETTLHRVLARCKARLRFYKRCWTRAGSLRVFLRHCHLQHGARKG
jgi:hypothetical protein